MRRIKAFGLTVVVVLAISAMSAGTASAARLTLSEAGTALAPGDQFEIYGDEALSFFTSRGRLECEDSFVRSAFELAVVTNGSAKDELRLEGFSGGSLGPCRSFTGNADVELSLGGPIDLRGSGKATSGGASVLIVFEHIEYHEATFFDVECDYAAGHLSGANNASPTREPIRLELGGKLRLDTSASSPNARKLCPTTAEAEIEANSSESDEREDEPIEEQT